MFHYTFVPIKTTYTYLGHSAFLVEMDDTRILFDPFISPNPLAKEVDVDGIECDYIILSHAHFDHTADVESIAMKNDALVVSNYEIATYYGTKKLRYHPMNTGGQWNFGKFQVKAVNAVHSSVFSDGTYGGNPNGYIISNGEQSFYYSGDTALTLDMQLIGSYYKIDRAFLCMGDNFTMGPDDAMIASDFIRCNQITGMHFDTFPYIKLSHEEVMKKYEIAGKKLILPEINKTYDL